MHINGTLMYRDIKALLHLLVSPRQSPGDTAWHIRQRVEKLKQSAEWYCARLDLEASAHRVEVDGVEYRYTVEDGGPELLGVAPAWEGSVNDIIQTDYEDRLRRAKEDADYEKYEERGAA